MFLVYQWEQGEQNHHATFTDSKNQIDAIISRDSPDAQGATSPCPPSVKGGPRHLVELSDIKLIFTYSAASPDVYIHVNRLKVHRNAVPKGDVPKPKLKKAASLRALMTMASEKIQQTREHAGLNSQTNTGLTDSIVSRRDQAMHHSQDNSASQLLISQPPPNMRQSAPKRNLMANRVSLNGSSGLLGFLAASHPIQAKDTASKGPFDAHEPSLGEGQGRHSPLTNTNYSVRLQDITRPLTRTQPSLRRFSSNTTDAMHAGKSASDSSNVNIEQDVDDLIAECRVQVALSLNESDDHERAHTAVTGDNGQFSRKRHRGSTDVPSQTSHDNDLSSQIRQSSSTLPSKKRQRIDAGEVMPVDPTEFEQVQNKPVPSLPSVQIVSTKADIACPSTTNPWQDMTKIPLSEVDIPKDQVELLEGLKWIPQDPGVPAPLCHVPPRLLTQWNNIARRRQPLAEEAEEEEQVSERALTPTQQDPYTSPLPWSPSPERTPARDVLPRDTASPPTYVRPTRKIPSPTSTQYSIDRSAEDGNASMVNVSCSAHSQPGHEDIDTSMDGMNSADHQHSPSSKEVTTKPKNSVSLDHNPDDDPFPKHNASKSLDVANVQPSGKMQEHSHNESPAENAPFKSDLCDESSSDESDEPEMETYVPFALGGSLPLSSQPEQEPTSSGPLLPRFVASTIQVVETPTVHTTRLNPEKKSKQRAEFQPPSSQLPYSEAPKTSPASRILNTYRSQDSHGHSVLSQEVPNLSLPVLEDNSLRVDVLGTQTQTSSVHAPSQATVQSSSDVVLDSSRPAQRQRGSSIFHLDHSDDPSSFPYASCHSLPMSQLHEPSQDSSRGPFSLDGASQLPELSPMELTAWVAAHEESPSKSSRPPRCENADVGQKAPDSPNAELVARRQGFIDKSDKYAEAQTIYEKFCNDYSSYSGDFAHFTEMCSRLRTMRQRGQLQRSFLWDDFVIQHLEEYPRYFEERASQDSKSLGYEDFFCSKFSRPQHKKRSLTGHGVDIVASQFVRPTSAELANPQVLHQVTIQAEVTQNKAMQSEVANPSFTASLVEKLSTLHAQSFVDLPVPDISMPTATQSSSSPSASTSSDSVEVKTEPDDSSNESIGSQIITSSNDYKPVFSSHDEEMIDATQYDINNIRIAPDPSDVEMAETGMDEIDETQEQDDTHHETASIELGDDTVDFPISAFPAPPAALGSLKVAEPERPRQRRPWFRSLQKIFPTGPVWSDDPDTPFKRWARQDQNVLQELKRRGGARVLTDEKGVIRWPTCNQEKNPNP
ncbi:hypothetical protein PITC_016180 [Penicillium italicum]|uniref:Telomere replication protein EST3 n=1 Tax=Penicillium italicum TaxID=40296 RepID=A0A0A2LF08_PENIT|nr:hypothetical protein PITC_016180 [Penicillium italicum]